MIGIAAVAMTAAFTSCSKDKDFEQVSQVQLDESKYQAAFESRFGKIDPNHDWGFNKYKKGAAARTRADIDANGNQWTDKPTIGATERQDVYNYVKTLTNLVKAAPTDLTDYYVTQIRKGDETYTDYNKQATFTGSDKMDELMIADQSPYTISEDPGTLDNASSWFHVYDFNSGNNTDYDGHMRVLNSATLNFAYHNSLDSKWHDKWIGVDGADIPGGLYSNYYYICFDYESIPASGSDNFTEIVWYTYGPNNKTKDPNGEKFDHKTRVPGAYTLDMLKEEGIKLSDTMIGRNDGEFTVDQEGTFGWAITQVSKGDKLVEGDNVYTDWIIRLVKANTTGGGDNPGGGDDLPKGDVRVIVEDMKAADEWDGVQFKGDFDFNDVVFDVVYDYDDTQSAIILQAAGGTLPLYLTYAPSNFSVEVHEAFGGYGTGEMINTGAGPNAAPKLLKLGAKIENADLIVVTVNVPSQEAPVVLKAEPGKAPHKIAVPTSFNWMTEWKDIETDYPGFTEYVASPGANWTK